MKSAKEAIEAVAKRSGKGEQDLEWLIANLEHRGEKWPRSYSSDLFISR